MLKVTLDDFRKLDKVLEMIPPVVVRIQVQVYGYTKIQEKIPTTIKDELQAQRNNGYIGTHNGIDLEVMQRGNRDFLDTQAKVFYSDGSSKVIDII